MTHSQLLKASDFDSFDTVVARLPPTQGRRKLWEWCSIATALEERGMLQRGMKGLGFGVGLEPLAGYFAARGAKILATDWPHLPLSKEHWGDTGQLARSAEDVKAAYPGNYSLQYAEVDMNNIPRLSGYDFCWSASSLDHLGSHEKGFEFIRNSLKCLRPGGWAVHTTEFTFNPETVTEDYTVFFREQDLTSFFHGLELSGYKPERLDFTRGDSEADLMVDYEPHTFPESALVLQSYGLICTSIILIVQA